LSYIPSYSERPDSASTASPLQHQDATTN